MEEVWVLIFQILLIRMEFAAFFYVMKYSWENAYIIIIIVVVIIVIIVIIIIIIIIINNIIVINLFKVDGKK